MLFRKSALVLSLVIGLVCGFLVQANAKEKTDKPYAIITTAELKTMLDYKKKEIVVVDARNPEEYEDVHIPGAVNIPQKKFEQYEHLLPKQKATALVFYCNGVK